jgi:hypothetical protein
MSAKHVSSELPLPWVCNSLADGCVAFGDAPRVFDFFFIFTTASLLLTIGPCSSRINESQRPWCSVQDCISHPD